ncbi:MAG: hypothetical protein IOD12_05610, partial [Silvanigrellales bacterium]|nr:hypothetical protein [Silvanigrellales bacterium]
AVTVGNPKTASATDSEGKRLPFENGFYQMLTFLMSSRSLSEAEGTSEPVVPLANTENAKDTIDDLVKPIRQRFGQRIEEDPKGVITDALRRISKIQNPHLNDVNTTDCVSCHRATAVDHLFVPRMNSSEDLVKVRDEVAAELLQSGLRYSHEKQSAFVSPSAIQTDKYSVLNFGYFRDKASVSFRTANESSYSAEFTNNLLGLQRSPTCASERLAACVDSYFTRFGTMDIVTDQNFDEALDEELNDRIIVHSCYVLTCGKSPFSPTQLDKVKVVKAGQNSQ